MRNRYPHHTEPTEKLNTMRKESHTTYNITSKYGIPARLDHLKERIWPSILIVIRPYRELGKAIFPLFTWATKWSWWLVAICIWMALCQFYLNGSIYGAFWWLEAMQLPMFFLVLRIVMWLFFEFKTGIKFPLYKNLM